MTETLRIARTRPDAILPRYATSGAAGLDVSAAIDAPIVLEPGARALVTTGLVLGIPHGHEVQVRPRSGLALKHGVTVANAPGTIDEDYRGELAVILVNLGSESFVVTPGERVAQIVVAPVTHVGVVEMDTVDALGETERGAAGFGSTGR